MENNLDSIKAQKEERNLSFDIELKWEEQSIENEARVGAMYCFKTCGVNKN